MNYLLNTCLQYLGIKIVTSGQTQCSTCTVLLSYAGSSKPLLTASENRRQFSNLKGVLSSMEKRKNKNYSLNLDMIDNFQSPA